MNKQDLVNTCRNRHPLPVTNSQLNQIVDTVLEVITEALAAGDTVALRPFGQFATKQTSPRVGRNPKTGESCNIPGKTKVVFKASSMLAAKLNK